MARVGRKPIGDAPKEFALTIRLDRKTKYGLELVVRQSQKTATGIIEDAIKVHIKKLDIGGRTWLDFWDEHEGMRKLFEMGCSSIRLTADEEEMQTFVRHHREIFYVDAKATIPKRANVEVLWPKMQHYLELWRDARDGTALAAMKRDLRGK